MEKNLRHTTTTYDVYQHLQINHGWLIIFLMFSVMSAMAMNCH